MNSRLSTFLKGSLYDFALVLVACVALERAIAWFSYSATSLQGNLLLVAGAISLILIVLFAGGWSKRAALICGVATAILVVVYACVGVSQSTGELFNDIGSALIDEEGNYLVFSLVLSLTPVVVYLLSRRLWGTVILFFATILINGAAQFFYRDWLTVQGGAASSVVSLAAVLALCVYQCYRQSAYSADRASAPHFFTAFLYSVGVSVLCVGVGAAVFFGIVSGVNLSTPVIKPILERVSAPVEYYVGVYDKTHVADSSNRAKADDAVDETKSGGTNDAPSSLRDTLTENLASSIANMITDQDDESWEMTFNQLSYFIYRWGLAIAIAVVALLLALAVCLRVSLRKRRLRKLEEMPVRYRIWSLYNFFVKRFRRMSIKGKPQATPVEFAHASVTATAAFNEEAGGVDFAQLADVYTRACYSSAEPSDDDYQRFLDYYKPFFKNARKQMGWVKWMWKFWRI